MRYVIVISMVVALIILIASILNYLGIRKNLGVEIYTRNNEYKAITNIYVTLMIFFLLSYIAFYLYWLSSPLYDNIAYLLFALLFFGSVFVGISVLVLKHSLDAVLNVKLNELDTMTGLMTKNSFERNVQNILDAGYGRYTLAVVDMDKFKVINDVHGHVKGDEVIHATADIIKKTVRSRDMVGRFGGDEFLILFNGIHETQADAIMARIQNAIVEEQRKRDCTVCSGISYGVAEVRGGCGEKYQDVFDRADQSLYRMKKDKEDKVS